MGVDEPGRDQPVAMVVPPCLWIAGAQVIGLAHRDDSALIHGDRALAMVACGFDAVMERVPVEADDLADEKIHGHYPLVSPPD